MIKIKNIEITEEELRRIIKENPQVMTENKESKFFEPKEGEEYHFICSCGVDQYTNDSLPSEKNVILRGVYRTEAEAIQADNVRLALKRVWDSADSAKYFYRPDWSNRSESKYHLSYDHQEEKFTIDTGCVCQSNPFLPYFKSSEDCLAFAKENEKDLRIIWSVN